MGSAGRGSWNRQMQVAFAIGVDHCVTCQSSLELRVLDICKIQTLMMPLNTRRFRRAQVRSQAEAAHKR